MTNPAYNKNIFRLAHETILSSLQNIQSRARAFPEARKYFPDLTEALNLHLERQGDPFYPGLEAFFSDNRKALVIITFFKKDLKEVKVAYLMFQEKYATGCPRPIDIRRFPLDLSQFFGLLRSRIIAEEEYLLPLLDIYAGPSSFPV
jgi:hypothetical protein